MYMLLTSQVLLLSSSWSLYYTLKLNNEIIHTSTYNGVGHFLFGKHHEVLVRLFKVLV